MSLAAVRDIEQPVKERIDRYNAAVSHRKSRIPTQPTQPVWSEETRKRVLAPPTRYHPSHAQTVIDLMSNGYSLGAAAGRLGISRSMVTEWQERHPEFGAVVARARAASLFYWESKFIDAVERRDAGPGNMIMFALRNVGREDWKDKQEIEISGQVTFASIIDRAMKTIEARHAGEVPTEQIETTYQELAAPQDDLF